MEVINIVTLVIGSGGILGAFVTVYQVYKQSHDNSATTEVQAAEQASADWGTFTERVQAQVDRLENEIGRLRAEVKDLRDGQKLDQQHIRELTNDQHYYEQHIRILQQQIWAGIGPPPLKPGDDWPEPQIGG